MISLRSVLIGGILLALAGCSSMDVASRGATGVDGVLAGPGTTMAAPAYDVTEIRIDVPRSLRVSEANVFFPVADIVWHGDPLGDRYDQVQAIFEEAFATGTADLNGPQKVIVQAEITRFHALTPKTRYTVGGTHSLHFLLTVIDAKTGQIIDGPRAVVADVKASGGDQAIREEAAGITQKMVIEERLAQVIHDELTAPVAVQGGGEQVVSRQEFSPVDLNIVE